MNINWSFLDRLISSKNSAKFWWKFPLLENEKGEKIFLNVFFSKWINKDLIPTNIKKALLTEAKDNKYLLWLDKSDKFLVETTKADLEKKFQSFVSSEINKFEKSGYSEIIKKWELNENDLISFDEVYNIQEEILADDNFNEYKKNKSSLDFTKFNKPKDLLNENLTEYDFEDIIRDTEKLEKYKKYIAIHKNLWFSSQVDLFTNTKDDTYKVLAMRQDLNPTIAESLFQKEETRPFILANDTYFPLYYKKTIHSLHKNSPVAMYKALLKNKTLNPLEIKEIYDKAPKETKSKLIWILKEQRLDKLEEAWLLDVALSDKKVTQKLFNNSLITNSYLNDIILPKIISTTDLYDKLFLILSVLNNKYSRFEDIKKSVEDIYNIFKNNIPKEYNPLKEEIESRLAEYNSLKPQEYFVEVYTPNVNDYNLWKNFVNSQLSNNIAYTWFWINNNDTDKTFFNVIHTKWFPRNSLDKALFKNLDRNAEGYLGWVSTSTNLQNIWEIHISPFLKEWKEDFFNLFNYHVEKIKKWNKLQEKVKESKFILKSKNPINNREIQFEEIENKLGYVLTKWDIIAQENQYEDCYKDIRFNQEKFENMYVLAKSKLLNLLVKNNMQNKIIANTNYFIDYTLNSGDTAFLKTNLKKDEFEKVFSKSFSIKSDYLKFLVELKDSIMSKRPEKIKEGFVKIKSKTELKNQNLWNLYWFMISWTWTYQEDLSDFPENFEQLHFLIESLRMIIDSLKEKAKFFEWKFISSKLKDSTYENDAVSVISPSKSFIINNEDEIPFRNRFKELNMLWELLLKEEHITMSWDKYTFETLFSDRRVWKIKEEIANLKAKLATPWAYRNYFVEKYGKVEGWIYYLEEKIFKLTEDDIFNNSYNNPKGLYTMRKIQNLKKIADELQKSKFEKNEYSLWIEDYRHLV